MNDVLKEQGPAFLKLTDSAEALLQAMEGLVMILNVQVKAIEIHAKNDIRMGFEENTVAVF